MNSSVKVYVGGCNGRDSGKGTVHNEFGDLTTAMLVHNAAWAVQFDLGTGTTLCSDRLEALEADGVVFAGNVISHDHWDHLGGDNSFKKFTLPGIHKIRNPILTNRTEEVVGNYLRNIFDPCFWPYTEGTLDVGFFNPGDTLDLIPGGIRTIRMPHPGGVVAYRFDDVVIATDVELTNSEDRVKLASFSEGARMMFLDLQYRRSEYDGVLGINGGKPMSRKNWGHSTPDMALEMLKLMANPPANLYGIHHEPGRTSKDIRGVEAEAQKILGDYTTVTFARQDDEY